MIDDGQPATAAPRLTMLGDQDAVACTDEACTMGGAPETPGPPAG